MIRVPLTSLHAPWVLLSSIAMAAVLIVAAAGAGIVLRPPVRLKGVARTAADLLCMATWCVLGVVHLRRHRNAEHQVWVAWLRFRAAEQAEERPQWHLDPGDWAALEGERGHRP